MLTLSPKKVNYLLHLLELLNYFSNICWLVTFTLALNNINKLESSISMSKLFISRFILHVHVLGTGLRFRFSEVFIIEL